MTTRLIITKQRSKPQLATEWSQEQPTLALLSKALIEFDHFLIEVVITNHERQRALLSSLSKCDAAGLQSFQHGRGIHCPDGNHLHPSCFNKTASLLRIYLKLCPERGLCRAETTDGFT